MQWSMRQSLVEPRFAPSVPPPVSLHQARYRDPREALGRVWLMVDGRDAASFATGTVWPQVRAQAGRLMDARDAWGSYSVRIRAHSTAAGR